LRKNYFHMAEKNVRRANAGSTASILDPLKAKEHVIPDRPEQRQLRNALIYSAQ
jgi:hypothetical protein